MLPDLELQKHELILHILAQQDRMLPAYIEAL
jgi:hypothetical protein